MISIEYLKKEKLEGKQKMNFKKNISLLGIALVCSGALVTSGTVFAATDISQDTPVSAQITVEQLPEKPIIPNPTPGGGDNTGGDNTKPNPSTAKVSIAYQPVAFTGNAALTNSADSASVDLSASNMQGGNKTSVAHVGVKDQTKEKNTWKLQGSFTTQDDQLIGSTITLKNGKVQMNDAGTLKPLANDEVIATATPTLSTTPTDLLSADNTKVQYGVYDYQFDNIKLNIPNPAKVGAGQHTGNVNWNLMDAPN